MIASRRSFACRLPLDCLLVVDVQAGFINRWTADVPPRIEALIPRFNRMVATRFINRQGSFHRRLIGWDRCGPGSADTEFAFAMPPGTLVVEKDRYGCVDDDFLATLANWQVDHVHIAGIATDNCVLKCAVDLFEAGIEPIVILDACASHGGPDCHASGAKLLRRFIGEGQVVEAAHLSPEAD